MKERLNSQGLDAVGSKPEALARLIREDIVMHGRLVKTIGLKPQ